jgi:AcrR family transcriptional regulator
MNIAAQAQGARPASTSGLREKKVLRTRRALQDAALTLFAEQGYDHTTVEQIAARAELGPATFFRHFPSKADVVLNFHDALLPALADEILRRPGYESDFLAIKNAIKHVWVIEFDPAFTARLASVIARSPTLRALSYEVGRGWPMVVGHALAQRQGFGHAPQAYVLRARVALVVFSHAVGVWIANNCVREIGDVIDEQYRECANILAEL